MAKKQTRASKIRKFIIDNPTAKTAAIAKLFDTRYQNVYAVRRKMETAKVAKTQIDLTPALKFLQGRAQAEKEDWKTLSITSTNAPMQIEMFEPKADPVNHPAHYKVGGIETIDFIEAKNLGYNLGNVVKYITRADHKGNKLEDLRKAQWYLTRAIETAK